MAVFSFCAPCFYLELMVNVFSLSTVKLSQHTLYVQGWRIQGVLEGGGGPSALLTEVYSQYFILSNYSRSLVFCVSQRGGIKNVHY